MGHHIEIGSDLHSWFCPAGIGDSCIIFPGTHRFQTWNPSFMRAHRAVGLQKAREGGRRCGPQWWSGKELLVGSLWFCSVPTLTLVTRGPQALVFLALDERVQAEGLVLAGWGWT